MLLYYCGVSCSYFHRNMVHLWTEIRTDGKKDKHDITYENETI